MLFKQHENQIPEPLMKKEPHLLCKTLPFSVSLSWAVWDTPILAIHVSLHAGAVGGQVSPPVQWTSQTPVLTPNITTHITFNSAAAIEGALSWSCNFLLWGYQWLLSRPSLPLSPGPIHPLGTQCHASIHSDKIMKFSQIIKKWNVFLLFFSFFLKPRKGTPLHPDINAAEIMKKMPAAIKAKKEVIDWIKPQPSVATACDHLQVREAVERACNYFVYLNDLNKTKVQAEASLYHRRAIWVLR